VYFKNINLYDLVIGAASDPSQLPSRRSLAITRCPNPRAGSS